MTIRYTIRPDIRCRQRHWNTLTYAFALLMLADWRQKLLIFLICMTFTLNRRSSTSIIRYIR